MSQRHSVFLECTDRELLSVRAGSFSLSAHKWGVAVEADGKTRAIYSWESHFVNDGRHGVPLSWRSGGGMPLMQYAMNSLAAVLDECFNGADKRCIIPLSAWVGDLPL